MNFTAGKVVPTFYFNKTSNTQRPTPSSMVTNRFNIGPTVPMLTGHFGT